MSYITAKVEDVAIGNFVIAGLMDNYGNFYVGVPQIVTEFSFDNRQASRDIKNLMGKDFSFDKLKTPLNSKVINAIPLNQFEILLARLDRKGNLKAQQIRDDLAGLSLRQLFADAFHQRFDEQDRQEFLIARQQGKVTRRLLSDVIKDYIDRHCELSDNHKKWLHKNCTDQLYRALFNKSATKLKEVRECTGELRNTFSIEELHSVEKHEEYAAKLIDKLDTEPQEAIQQAIDFYC